MTIENDMKNSETEHHPVRQTEQAIREASAKASRVVCEKSSEAMDCATESIRRHPVSSVAGALVFGIAVGVLIASGRSSPTFCERYLHNPLDHASDAISSLGRNSRNLKFW